jgi:hypothetical protein
MTDSSMLKYQYDTILDQLILLQLHAENPECPCSLKGPKPGELGEYCEPKHLRSIIALARETISMEDNEERLNYLEDLVTQGSELLKKMESKLCGAEVDTGDYATWSRDVRKPLENFCYSGFCSVERSEEEAAVEEIAEMFKRREPTWCSPVRATEKELGGLYRTLGTARKKITELRGRLDVPLNICRGQAEMFEEMPAGVLDPYGSRCRDPETGQWTYSELCGAEPAGITTEALGMDGLTRYEFEFKIVDMGKLIVSHDPFTFEVNPDYPQELQPRIRERAATKLQVEKIAANLEPDAVITDFHVIDRGAPIVGQDMVVEAGNGRVMGIERAAAEYPEKYEAYKKALKSRASNYGLKPQDVDDIPNPILVRVRITDVDRAAFTQEANQAATISTSAIENARTDAQKITIGMLQELIIGEDQSLEDALRAPKNQPFAKRFLSTLPENVQAALLDSQGYLNRDGVHRMAMAIFVSAFQGDAGLRLAEKAFESVDLDVRNIINAIARSLGPLAQAEALTRSGDRDSSLSIGDDLAQAVIVYSAIKRTPGMSVDKYLAQAQLFARELTPFQEEILKTLEKYKSSPRKLANVLRAYAEAVIKSPPPAQGVLIPGEEIEKEALWAIALGHAEEEPAPALFEDEFDICAEATKVLKMYQSDIEAGHTDASEFWNGQGQILAKLCLLRRAKMKDTADFQQEACEMPAARYQHLAGFFSEGTAEPAILSQETAVKERKIDQALAKLEEGIAEIQDSANFKAFVDTMAKFHNYSLGNIMLITLQRPSSTRVAGFNRWKELGRNVKKGEHGIMILAPCFPARPKREEPEEEEEEEEERMELEPSPLYFKVVYVFDVEQTEGKELPAVEVPVLTGEKTGVLYQNVLSYIAKQGFNFSDKTSPDLDPDIKGFWSKPQHMIWVKPGEPQDQRTKTALHETAHAKCEMRGARDAEVMAESVAYVVGSHFGFDTGARSFPYVATWAGDIKVLKANLEIIRKVSMDMIEGIEQVASLSENGFTTAGFPLDPREENSADINRFYAWTGGASPEDLLRELCERANYLGAQLCLVNPGDTVDKETAEHYCPYVGSEPLYSELSRFRFLCYKLTDVLPTSVTILAPPMAETKSFLKKTPEAEMSQGIVQGIGASVVTGMGIGAGFKIIDWLADKFRKQELKEEEMDKEYVEVSAKFGIELPKDIEVWPDVIEKHYRYKEEFYPDSFRVTKPEPDINIYLGCLKTDNWDGETCSPTQTVHKTVVPNTPEYREAMDHLLLVHPGIKVEYKDAEVQENREELKAVDKALDKAEEA